MELLLGAGTSLYRLWLFWDLGVVFALVTLIISDDLVNKVNSIVEDIVSGRLSYRECPY